MLPRVIALASLVIGCASHSPRAQDPAPAAGPSEAQAQRPGEIVGMVELPDRITGHYGGKLFLHVIDFDLPPDIEMARTRSGYSWSSPEEHSALAIFAGIYPHDALAPATDPPLAVARTVIAGVGGDVDLLHDRHRLDAPADASGTGWRIAAAEAGGWLAIYLREATSQESRRFYYVVFVLAMGPSGSRWSHDGAAVATIRDSIRFRPL